MHICNDKKTTTNLLKQANISIPQGFVINKNYDKKYLADVYESLKKPLVVKPSNGTWGENVTVNITTYEEYLQAIKTAFKYSTNKNTSIVAEEMFLGKEYRILATKEKILGILKKEPANVVGNGLHTIEQLIDSKNLENAKIKKKSKNSKPKIKINKELKEYLLEQKLELSSVLKKEQKKYLRQIASISQGGDAIDFTDKAHESVKEIALKAIRSIPGLSLGGIDFLSTDVTKKQTKKTYVIIEINTSPGLLMHNLPDEGENRRVAKEFLFLMFPELEN